MSLSAHTFTFRHLTDNITPRSGFFPAATYLCSSWYRPHELAFRLSLFMAVSAASGAFSGLLAAGIGQLGGVGGLTSWQWIFLIEGCVTMLMGLASFFLLVDTPSRSGSWLDEEEIRFLGIQRFVKDGGPGVDKERALWTDVKTVFTDWRYWAFGLFFHSIGACGYGECLSAFPPRYVTSCD